MSDQSPSGTTAFQVSPADLTQLIHFAEGMMGALQALRTAQEQVRNLNYDLEGARRNIDNLAAENVNMAATTNDLRNKLSLLETQNAGTEQQLNAVITERETLRRQYQLEKEGSDKLAHQLEDVERQLADTRKERDDALFSNLEVSEALASANAKLDKFRELLGVGIGSVGSPVVEPRPATSQAPEQAPVPEVVLPATPSAIAPPVPLESNPSTDSGIGTGGYLQGDRVEDHQNEMPVKDERAADGPSAFPSPAPIVEGSPKPEAASEHGSSGPKVDPYPENAYYKY